MGFTAKQTHALRRNVDVRQVRTREANGRELSYIEGRFVIAEANRIFGFDGWSRETIETRCVVARENRGTFLAVYTARVRITVHAEGATVIREGHGSGEGRGASPGEVHDIALKAAETDATKRALATFGKPFGLELYRQRRTAGGLPTSQPMSGAIAPTRFGFHPDDTTPIPRPSKYYGRRESQPIAEHFKLPARPANPASTSAPHLAPAIPELSPAKIDKSVLALAEPKRRRDKSHLRFVASQACLVCGRHPSDPHHLRFAQPRALGAKVSDEFTVPLCRVHHRQLHQAGNIQAEILQKRRHPKAPARKALDVFYTVIPSLSPAAQSNTDQQRESPNETAHSGIARSFLRLASIDSGVFDRLGRYEMSLWRQTVQIVLLLNSVSRSANEYAASEHKYLQLRHLAGRRRRAVWPPFETSR